MKKSIALLIALGMGLAGCSSRSQFPWSLAGKTIPEYTIVNQEKVSASDPVLFTVSAVVAESISRDDLTLVSQQIIEGLPRHNQVTIFYYSDAKQAEGEFTVGKAWWGVESDQELPPPGDYSHHVLKVELK